MNEIICGNAYEELSKIDEESVDLIVTSPPYYGQRSYLDNDIRELGTEKLLVDYVRRLGAIFSKCVRICKPTGNIIFNLGDKYQKGCLQLIPYRFAINAIDYNYVTLVNNITWMKSNPTPRQYNKRLISSTEPFFHFVKSDKYYYNMRNFLTEEKKTGKITNKKGQGYRAKIKSSNLTIKEKLNALMALNRVIMEVKKGKIYDFRMKIRGIHKKAFGGQSGGRNSQIDKQGYTIIKLKGGRIKRDIIESPVANTRNIDHPAVFPLKVIKNLVSLLSRKGDFVVDPFCGSGQVCLVAKSLDRSYLGIDLNPDYCELARNRLNGN